MAVVDWGREATVVVALTQIEAVLITWMAPGLVRVSLDMGVVIVAESCSLLRAALVVTGLWSFGKAGYGVQLIWRLRSDCKEFFEALEDMRVLGDGGELSSWKSLPFK